jgi:hypothetical protein
MGDSALMVAWIEAELTSPRQQAAGEWLCMWGVDPS